MATERPRFRVHPGFAALCVFIAMLGQGAGASVRDYRPPLLCVVSDDTLQSPFGSIVDVAVHGDLVYLLDRQTFQVHRIRTSGEVLPPLGREGDGPGEFRYPAILAMYPDGRCLVIQDFYARPVCFRPDGRECNAPDLSGLRGTSFMTIYARTEVDGSNRLLVGCVTTSRSGGGTNPTPEELGAQAGVLRLERPEGGTVVSLFTTDQEQKKAGTVILPRRNERFVYGCWDQGASGLLYADPAGAYRVYIRDHIGGTEQRTVVLSNTFDDEPDIRRIVKESGAGIDTDAVPRIMSVGWLRDGLFYLQPTAVSLSSPPNVIGTFDVFRPDGTAVGRFRVLCEYDSSEDLLFIRDTTLVIVEGGRSAIRAGNQVFDWPEAAPSSPEKEPDDAMHVRIYEFFGNIDG